MLSNLTEDTPEIVLGFLTMQTVSNLFSKLKRAQRNVADYE